MRLETSAYFQEQCRHRDGSASLQQRDGTALGHYAWAESATGLIKDSSLCGSETLLNSSAQSPQRNSASVYLTTDSTKRLRTRGSEHGESIAKSTTTTLWMRLLP